MAFSFSRIILSDTEIQVYYRGLEYADKKKIKIKKLFNNACLAEATGSDMYAVELSFNRVGSPKYSCSCPYYQGHNIICKHIIGAALVWDRGRKVPDPDDGTVKNLSIPEPPITRKDINNAYEDQLEADLDIIRYAADELRGARRHAKLPLAPQVCLLSPGDIKKGITEIKSWARRSSYDPYFCAGEMVAGFCELVRSVRKSLERFSSEELVVAAEQLSGYHHELITGTIDDSDGLHEFSEAHLTDLFDEILCRPSLTGAQALKITEVKDDVTDY
ncbi:MAG: SWIM zinc finger family protein [bacterium]|nr:SWIM zinc finger family protein [bacterium]